MARRRTNEEKKEMARLKLEVGLTYQAIAEQYDCCIDTVKNAVEKYKEENKVKEEEMKMENKVENKIYDPIVRKCIRCGDEFVISPAEQKIFEKKGFDFPKRCKSCRFDLRQNVKLICVDCGKEFEISQSEKESLEAKGFAIPKRCKSCIEFKKQANIEQNKINEMNAIKSMEFEDDD